MRTMKSNKSLDEWHLNALKRINVHFKCVTCHAKVFPFTTATMFAASLSFVLKSSGSRGKAKTITFYYYLSWYWSKTLVPALFFLKPAWKITALTYLVWHNFRRENCGDERRSHLGRIPPEISNSKCFFGSLKTEYVIISFICATDRPPNFAFRLT